MTWWRVTSAWLLGVLVPRVAAACPDCAPARVVQASVYDASFPGMLSQVLLPLLVLGLICERLYRVGQR